MPESDVSHHPADRLIRRPEVMALTSLSTTEIYRRMRTNEFPKAHKIGGGHNGAVAWRESEVREWIERLPRTDGASTPTPEAAA